jgi:hypothetical protein
MKAISEKKHTELNIFKEEEREEFQRRYKQAEKDAELIVSRRDTKAFLIKIYEMMVRNDP